MPLEAAGGSDPSRELHLTNLLLHYVQVRQPSPFYLYLAFVISPHALAISQNASHIPTVQSELDWGASTSTVLTDLKYFRKDTYYPTQSKFVSHIWNCQAMILWKEPYCWLHLDGLRQGHTTDKYSMWVILSPYWNIHQHLWKTKH